MPAALSLTGTRKREYFRSKAEAEKRALQIRDHEQTSARVVREAGPDLIRAALNFVMNCVWENDREITPFFAITLFAGLRPDQEGEIGSLKWEDVNFDERWIRVNFHNKTGTKRFVPIESNLLAWLQP